MNEEEKITELLKPRYLVIADYPSSPQGNQIGFIYDRNNKDWSNRWFNEMSQYPHLFQPLPWWSHRKIEDMPEYVKDENGVYKVKEWHFELAPKVTVFIDAKIHQQYRKECTECPLYSDFLPATLHDYEQYTNHKTV